MSDLLHTERTYDQGLIPSRWRGGGWDSRRRILDAAWAAAWRGERVLVVYPRIVVRLYVPPPIRPAAPSYIRRHGPF